MMFKYIVFVLFVALSGCSRDHIEAVELSNEADSLVDISSSSELRPELRQMYKDMAIEKYNQALALDPTNKDIITKLNRYENRKYVAPKIVTYYEDSVLCFVEIRNTEGNLSVTDVPCDLMKSKVQNVKDIRKISLEE